MQCTHTNARALEDEGRAECATANDDLFTGPINLGMVLSWSEWLCGNGLDTDGTSFFEDHLLDLGVTYQVQILVMSACGVDVCVGGIRTTSSIAGTCQFVLQETLHSRYRSAYRLIHFSQCSAP